MRNAEILFHLAASKQIHLGPLLHQLSSDKEYNANTTYVYIILEFSIDRNRQDVHLSEVMYQLIVLILEFFWDPQSKEKIYCAC